MMYADRPLSEVPRDQLEFEKTRRAEAKNRAQDDSEKQKVFQELQTSLNSLANSVEGMRRDVQNLAQKVTEKDDNSVLIARLNEIIKTLKTLDAHELRKIAERLLSKTEAEEKYESRLKSDRVRRNRWREKNE